MSRHLENKVPVAIDQETFLTINPVLLRRARYLVGSEALAEDLVQETWHAATRGLDRFDGRASLKTWLVGILKNKVIDNWRRNRREVPLDEHAESPTDERADARLDDERAVRLLKEKLKRLPDQQRTAVQLVDVEDKDRDDVADKMQVTRAHLRVILHRGRQDLRRALERENVGL
jgi:RNA polymerase sigma-70 factor (ECF subfamily)